jgi:uncharacterized RmlC-like cupin family protein
MQETSPVCRLIRGGSTYEGKQELTYLHGISRETAGAQAICMHVLSMPPVPALGRTFTNTTRLRSTCCRVGLTPGRGQAGVPHLPANLTESPASAIVAPTVPNEQESVLLLPHLDAPA